MPRRPSKDPRLVQPPHTLYTIGYEKAGFANFIATLKRTGVATVIDVRDLPLSRRAGFSKRQLAAGLDEAGIGYLHLRALGTPPEGREANRRRQWPRFWEIVEERLALPEGAAALEEAASTASAGVSCLLCYEADPCICHRRRVGEMLAASHGFTIENLHVTADFEP
jgi:uncharacterized protein (DUF488 family)